MAFLRPRFPGRTAALADDACSPRRSRVRRCVSPALTTPGARLLPNRGVLPMDGISALAVFVGAGLGALLRWGLGMALNPLFPTLPLGPLAANVLGGLLMGAGLGVLAPFGSLPAACALAGPPGFPGGP